MVVQATEGDRDAGLDGAVGEDVEFGGRLAVEVAEV